MSGSTPLFIDGARVEVSTDQAGTQFFAVESTQIKNGGTKLVIKSKINGQKIGDFIPDGASRVIRLTNSTCGVVILHVHRSGDQLLPDATAVQSPSPWQ